jgi:tRNA pseudouridine55 synthase
MEKGIITTEKGMVLLVDKPLKWTSFDAVNKIKWLYKNAAKVKQEITATKAMLKVGHAGTLDPLASGLLIICLGQETKNIDTYQQQEKEYIGTFFIGATTPCFDLEKPVDAIFPISHITNEMIMEVAKKFTGEQLQLPPIFSALRINCKRAYDLARAGKETELKPRPVVISEFEITRIALPEIDFKVVCSKGTYIRSLARDFGKALNSGAYLQVLRRTRIGNFSVNDALNVEAIQQYFQQHQSKNVIK